MIALVAIVAATAVVLFFVGIFFWAVLIEPRLHPWWTCSVCGHRNPPGGRNAACSRSPLQVTGWDERAFLQARGAGRLAQYDGSVYTDIGYCTGRRKP